MFNTNRHEATTGLSLAVVSQFESRRTANICRCKVHVCCCKHGLANERPHPRKDVRTCVCSVVQTTDFISRPRSGELRTQKLKSHLVKTQSLNVLPFKPEVGQAVYSHTCYAYCQGFLFLACFYTSGPFNTIFSKASPDFSCVGCG